MLISFAAATMALVPQPLFDDLVLTEDRAQMASWVPLMLSGRRFQYTGLR